jgi:hypothetical protein
LQLSAPQAGQQKSLQDELVSNRELLCSFFKRLLFFTRKPVDDFFRGFFGDGDAADRVFRTLVVFDCGLIGYG